jgi:hypothetical protein
MQSVFIDLPHDPLGVGIGARDEVERLTLRRMDERRFDGRWVDDHSVVGRP